VIPACYRLTSLALFYQLSVFLMLCIMNTLLHFLLCQSCLSLRNVSLGGLHIPFLVLIKRSYHGWLIMMASSEGPVFQPCLGLPNPKSTAAYIVHRVLYCSSQDKLSVKICQSSPFVTEKVSSILTVAAKATRVVTFLIERFPKPSHIQIQENPLTKV